MLERLEQQIIFASMEKQWKSSAIVALGDSAALFRCGFLEVNNCCFCVMSLIHSHTIMHINTTYTTTRHNHTHPHHTFTYNHSHSTYVSHSHIQPLIHKHCFHDFLNHYYWSLCWTHLQAYTLKNALACITFPFSHHTDASSPTKSALHHQM